MKRISAIVLAVVLGLTAVSIANAEPMTPAQVQKEMAKCNATARSRHTTADEMEVLKRCYTVFFLKTIYIRGTTTGHLNAVYGRDSGEEDMRYFWEQADLLWEKVIENKF